MGFFVFFLVKESRGHLRLMEKKHPASSGAFSADPEALHCIERLPDVVHGREKKQYIFTLAPFCLLGKRST